MRNNRLAVLAGEIRAAHEAALIAMQSAAERGKEAGLRLMEAKKLVKAANGRWLPWLKEIGIPARTARDYMQLARLKDDEWATVADLGLRAALETVRGADRDDNESDDTDEPLEPPEWSDDQLDRKERAEAGECVVANMRDDEALIAWARYGDEGSCTEELAHQQGRFVRIDRATDWGNPFEMPEDGDRGEVVRNFKNYYLPHKPGLLACIPQLRGKVLGCWCYPEDCHGHVIAAVVNEYAATGRDPEGIAEDMTDQDC